MIKQLAKLKSSLTKIFLLTILLILMTTSNADVQITQLNDLAFGIAPMNGSDITRNDNLCIYKSTVGGSYRVIATGSGPTGAFTVTDGFNTLAYIAKWNDQTGTTGNQQLQAGVPLILQNFSTSLNCTDSGANANIEVIFPGVNLTQAVANTYSGTLTLLIEPN